MRVAIVTETLCTGGAETFVLRLAAALLESGHAPSVVVLRGDRIEQPLISAIAPSVSVIPLRTWGLQVFLRLDGLLHRMRVKFSFVRFLHTRSLARLLRELRSEVAHSHLLNCDLVTAAAARVTRVPWITTMHGDYLAFEGKGGDLAARIPDFGAAVSKVEDVVSALVCISETQELQMRRLMPKLSARGGIVRIQNGYPEPGKVSAELPEILRQVPKAACVIGMVSRGVRLKGWEVLIRAFLKLDDPLTRLILVGDGPYLARIRRDMSDPRIIFVGAVTDPLRYIERFEVACLPTLFESESLPTVVIENLCLGKPVVAARVGEIPRMLRIGTAGPAGLVITQAGVDEMVDEMCSALRSLVDDGELRSTMGASAREAFLPYKMTSCLASYLALYKTAMES